MVITHRRTVLCLLVAITPLFFVTGPAFETPRSVLAVWDLGHVVFFALLAIVLYDYWIPSSYAPTRKILCIVLVAGILGLAIELLQLGLASRSVGWGDVARDIAGSVLVSFWRFAGCRQKEKYISHFARLAAIALGGVVCVPLYQALDDERRARSEFPVLSAFERGAELDRWRGSARLRLVTSPVRQGTYAAEVLLSEGVEAGVYLFYCPEDWRGKRALAFSVYNPESSLLVNIRVLDHLAPDGKRKIHSQYNDTLILASGWNDIAVPLQRVAAGDGGQPVDLARIWAFGIFVRQPEGKRSLFLDNVRLVD